jgi:hypothetical protein
MATYDLGCFGALLGLRKLPMVIQNTFLQIGSNKTDQLRSEQYSDFKRGTSYSTYAQDSCFTTVSDDKALFLTPTPSTASGFDDGSNGSDADVGFGETNPGETMGSSGHDAGTCKPCIWFWKQGSCRRGIDCEHCHLCDAKEIKRRRYALKRKATSTPVPGECFATNKNAVKRESNSTPAPEESDALKRNSVFTPVQSESFATNSGFVVTADSDVGTARVPQASRGSTGHNIGECRPCVWFWRPSSCHKGADCEYCHMCDEGAVARKVETRPRGRRRRCAGQ